MSCVKEEDQSVREREDLVLILAQAEEDVRQMTCIFDRTELKVELCPDIDTLCCEIGRGAGAILIAEAAFTLGTDSFFDILRRQPPWSDIPVIVLISGSFSTRESRLVRKLPGDVTLLERPVQKSTLVSTMRAAIRGRRRQYIVRDQLRELERREEELVRQANLLNISYDAIIVTDFDQHILFWNTGAERMYGWRREETEGKVVRELLKTEFPIPLPQIFEILRSRGRWEGELLHTKKNGEKITVLTRWAIHDVANDQRILEANTDITPRITAERREEATRRLLNVIVDSTPVPIAYVDTSGRYVYANAAYYSMPLLTREEITGKTLREVLGEKNYLQVADHLAEALKGKFQQFEVVREYPPPWGPRYLRIGYAPDVDTEGTVQGVVFGIIDLTDLKKTEQKLLAAKGAAEEANRAKGVFLANMSHEMRTPLAAVIGMVMLVLDMELQDEQRRLLETAKNSAEALLRIITDILEFSRLEAEEINPETKPFNLRSCLRTVIEIFKVPAREKNIALSSSIGRGVPETIVSDEKRLRRILVNIIGNAVKFTERGTVTVRTSLEGDEATGKEMLRFTVSDTGIGIEPEKLESLFDVFTQAERTSTRRYGGTGIGLALAKRIVEQLGGTIRAESTPNCGSTFYFTIPLNAEETVAAKGRGKASSAEGPEQPVS